MLSLFRTGLYFNLTRLMEQPIHRPIHDMSSSVKLKLAYVSNPLKNLFNSSSKRRHAGDDPVLGAGSALRADHAVHRDADPGRAEAPPLQEHRPLRPQARERPPLL